MKDSGQHIFEIDKRIKSMELSIKSLSKKFNALHNFVIGIIFVFAIQALCNILN